MKHHQPIYNINLSEIATAHKRIAGFIHNTPIINSSFLDRWLGCKLFFKCENLQKTGAFKARGAINSLLHLKEQGLLPKKVVAYSSGNHATAIAWAAKELGIEAEIFMPSYVSELKKQTTIAYGAKLHQTETRQLAERLAVELVKSEDAKLIPPYDYDDVILGQGTACYESLQAGIKPDAIFVPCGGGGLFSGSFLAKELLYKPAKIYGAEPLSANDAAISYRSNQIYHFDEAPITIADGVKTLSISKRTFYHIKQTDGIYEILEDEIIYWTQILTHILKMAIEPTSALAMAAASRWIKENKGQKILVIISAGNISSQTQQKIWEKDYLHDFTSKILWG